MSMKETQLDRFNNNWFNPGPSWKRALWFVINGIFFVNPLNPISSIKVFLLRLFGAKVGRGVVIKPGVNIKYPWKLRIGDHTWIGERCWIDNLAMVNIGANACLSQGSMLLCGNHNYQKSTFDLMVGDITLEEGVWIGAQSIVTPGVTCKSHAVLAVCSVATKDLEPYSIYQGNPAQKIKDRRIEE